MSDWSLKLETKSCTVLSCSHSDHLIILNSSKLYLEISFESLSTHSYFHCQNFLLSSLTCTNVITNVVFFLKCISYISITKMIILKCKTSLKISEYNQSSFQDPLPILQNPPRLPNVPTSIPIILYSLHLHSYNNKHFTVILLIVSLPGMSSFSVWLP